SSVVRRATRQPTDLLRQRLAEIPVRPRAEHRTAAAPLRRADRALPCTARPLLPPRLAVPTRNGAPRLRARGRLALIRQIRLHRLPERRLVHGAVEEHLREVALPFLLTVGRKDRCLEHGLLSRTQGRALRLA